MQIKAQILRGLLRKWEDGKEAEAAGATGPRHDPELSDDQSSAFRETWRRRDDLVKAGAVTPLDAFDATPVGLEGRRRKTLQDYKVAEGMTIKLPRSRRAKPKTRIDLASEAASRHELGGERAKTYKSSHAQDGPRDGAEDDNPQDQVECPICAQLVKVDDPANPDASLSKHLDRCTRRTRRGSRPHAEKGDFDRGDSATVRERPRKGTGVRSLNFEPALVF